MITLWDLGGMALAALGLSSIYFVSDGLPWRSIELYLAVAFALFVVIWGLASHG